ncbi:MAG: type IV pilus twitching motility protein PilT [Planctomycetota bacterium]
MLTLEDLVQQLVERGGSDLHISCGAPPMIRVHGRLVPTAEEILDVETSRKIVYSILDNEQILRFEKELELDMAFGITGLGRFRTNVFLQRGSVGAVIRVIPSEPTPLDQLGLPEETIKELCLRNRGLVLVTGATGSGKSTTLAAMIDFINHERNGHIITIEDPLEFVHRNKRCLVNQREVGTDTRNYKDSLRRLLRQDPDVVMIGELRDEESVSAALTLAETGHLTLGTLHTNDAVQTINRVIDVFPPHQQQQVRTQLSFSLEAVVSQQLVTRIDGKGRALAVEMLIANSAIRALIRDDKAHQIGSLLQTGGKHGMRTMNQSLHDLYRQRIIGFEEAVSRSTDPEDLKRIFQRQA